MRIALVLVLLITLAACGSSGGSDYQPPDDGVRVDSVSPNNGPQDGGQAVSIRGAGFSAGVISVFFGDAQATNIEVTSDNNINCVTPPGPQGSVDVTVNAELGSGYLYRAYIYNAMPQVFFVAPEAGYVGNAVSIVGANFAPSLPGETEVYFGQERAPGVTVVNDYTIFCNVPPNPGATVVDVTVVNPNGEDTRRNAFVYLGGVFAASRFAVAIEADEAGGPPSVLDVDLAAGETLLYTAERVGEGHVWKLAADLLLPFQTQAD